MDPHITDWVTNALCQLKAIEPIALFYRYILNSILVDTELVLSLISIAFFESYFLVLGSILESNRNEKVFNSIALKNRPIAMIKGICSNADVRNLYFKKNIRYSNKIFECTFFWVKSYFDIVDALF